MQNQERMKPLNKRVRGEPNGNSNESPDRNGTEQGFTQKYNRPIIDHPRLDLP
jgi:hypothetical protein